MPLQPACCVRQDPTHARLINLPGSDISVWNLHRLGATPKHVLEIVGDLKSRGIGFRSLTEGLHTDGAMGKMRPGIAILTGPTWSS